MNTVYEFGDSRKTAMPSDDLIDVDIEDYMGGEQGPDPDSQSGHAESDLPDEVPADDDNAGNKPAFSETGWEDDDEDGVTTMSSRQPRRRATRKTASGYYDHGGGVVELGVYGGDNQVGNAYGRIFAKQNADGTFDVVEVAYYAAVNSVMDDEADELIAANEVFVEEQTWEWKGISDPDRTGGESPDDITYRNDLLMTNVSLAEAERLAEQYARSLSARGDYIASRKRAEVDYTKDEVQPGSRAADVAGTPTPGKSVADYPQPQNVQHETAAEGWPIGNLTPAEAARLRKFRAAVKKNVKAGKVAFEYPEELGRTEDGIFISRYRHNGMIVLTYFDEGDQRRGMQYMDYTLEEALDRFRAQFGLPTPADNAYTPLIFGSSRRSPARRASRKRALQETQCSQCGKWSQSQFPGDLCLECWKKSPESQRMVSAEELVSMWGGPTRRRGSRRTAGYPEGTYEGWANYATWNVALWINNDQGLYEMAKEYDDYESFAESLREFGMTETPDGVALNDSGLDIAELDEMFEELRSEGRRRRGSRRTAERYPDVYVQLSGEDGNAFGILGRVQKELRRAGATPEDLKEFMDEATSGDYDHLLQTVMRWVKVGSRGSRRAASQRKVALNFNSVDEAYEAIDKYYKLLDFAEREDSPSDVRFAYTMIYEIEDWISKNASKRSSRRGGRRPFAGSRGGRPGRGMTKRAQFIGRQEVDALLDRIGALGERFTAERVQNSAYLLMVEGRILDKLQRAADRIDVQQFGGDEFPYAIWHAVQHVWDQQARGFDFGIFEEVYDVALASVGTLEQNFDSLVADAKAERADAWSTMGSRKRGSRDSYDAGFAKGVEDAENRMPQLEFTIDADPDWVSGYYDAYEAYGFDKLPDDFDSWNRLDKDEYLNDLRLRGYGSRKRASTCNHDRTKFYDGSLGYEAVVCKDCGTYWDHEGEHAADEWSRGFVGVAARKRSTRYR